MEGGGGAVGDYLVVRSFSANHNAEGDYGVVLLGLRQKAAYVRELRRPRDADEPYVFGVHPAPVERSDRVAHERVHQFLVKARSGDGVPVPARVDFGHFTFVETHF